MRWLITLFFFIFCIGCVQNNDPLFNLNSESYQAQAVSFDRRGSYSIKSLILSLSRSPLFKEALSKRERAFLSLSTLILSDDVENILIQSLNLRYDKVEAFRIEYRTPNPYTKSGSLKASGLILMPSTHKPLPLLVYFYPTLLHKNWAPSLIPLTTLSMNPLEDYRPMLIFLALQGYVVIVPDHIGYGSSEDKPHPYLYKESVVQTTTSLLQSAVNTLDEKGISIQRELFIMGYSQGGHGALAFAEAVQNSSIDFEIKAVSAGGGPYDLLYTAQELLDQKQILKLVIAPLLQSYSYIYNWNLDDIVRKESYADIISQIYKEDSLQQAVKALPGNTGSLFRSQFLRDIDTKRSNFYQQTLEENSVYDWEPNFPVLLFHVKKDDIVPYRNMEIAYRSLSSRRNSQIKKMNCNFNKVEDLIGIMGDLNRLRGNRVTIEPDHINCSFIFFLSAGDYFLNYKNRH